MYPAYSSRYLFIIFIISYISLPDYLRANTPTDDLGNPVLEPMIITPKPLVIIDIKSVDKGLVARVPNKLTTAQKIDNLTQKLGNKEDSFDDLKTAQASAKQIKEASPTENKELLEQKLKSYFELDSIPADVIDNIDKKSLEDFTKKTSKSKGIDSNLNSFLKENPDVFKELGKQKSDEWLDTKMKQQGVQDIKDFSELIADTKEMRLQEALKEGDLDITELNMLDSLLKANGNMLPKDLGELGKKNWNLEKDGKVYANKVFGEKTELVENAMEQIDAVQQERILPKLMETLPTNNLAADEDALLDEIKQKNKSQVKEEVISKSRNIKKVTIKDRKNPLPNNLLFENFVGITRGEGMDISLGTQVGKKINENLAFGLGLTFQHTEDKSAQVSTVLGYKAFGRYTMFNEKFAVLLENVSLIPDMSYLRVKESYNEFENTTLLGASYRVKISGKIGFSISVLYNFNDEISAPALDAPWLTRFGIRL